MFPVPCSLPSPPSTIGLLIRILGGGAHWGGGGGDEDGGDWYDDDADVYASDAVGQKTLNFDGEGGGSPLSAPFLFRTSVRLSQMPLQPSWAVCWFSQEFVTCLIEHLSQI